ncbi:hypothetical protein [Maricaulis sp.]|uniref:hypothetical protein n=1 Tax=Maricaulis sp. TaxID=1486257 RepID=UPI00261E2978|nr:hypothetical protein [Maricaulis sp.]
MSTWMQSTALALALTLTPAVPAQDEVAAWNADLDAYLDVLTTAHDNPYFLTPQAEFDRAVAAYRSGLPDMSYAERVTGLARIAALVGDGHTWMPMHAIPFHNPPMGPGFRSLPVRLEVFDEGVFIVGAAAEHDELLGARITRFGATSAQDAHAAIMSILPLDAVNFAAELAPEWLMQVEVLEALDVIDNADTVTLTLDLDGATRQVSLEPLAADQIYNWISAMDTGPAGVDWARLDAPVPFWMEPINGAWRTVALDDAVYLQIAEIRDGSDTSYGAMARAAVAQAEAMDNPALVLDLRRCMGGDGTLNAGLIEALSQSPVLNGRGRIAVLTSRQTHSAAVMLVSDLEQTTDARFYGQATADRPNHYGETNFFVTPNSHLPLLYASEYYQTSHAGDDRLSRTPDVPIAYRFADYAAGTDPVLAQALTDLTE